MTDYYAILGVSRNCTEEELKSAFRKAALKYHPDMNKDPRASTQFRLVVEAYDHISGDILRNARDSGPNARDSGPRAQKEPGNGHEHKERSPEPNPVEEPYEAAEKPETEHDQQIAQKPIVKLFIRFFIPILQFIENILNYVQMDIKYVLAVKWGFFIAALQVFLIMIIVLVSLYNALDNLIIGQIPACLLLVILPFAPTILAIWEARNRDLLSYKTRYEDLYTMIRIGFIAGIIGNAPILLALGIGTLLGLQILGSVGLFLVTILYLGVNSLVVPLGYYFE